MIDTVFNYLTLFDVIYAAITLLTVIQCSKKGFTLSLLSTSKWILAIIITIIVVPKLKPWINNYIKSDYAVDIGLGIIVFLLSIFIILLVSRGISKVVKYSGLGGLDYFFGFLLMNQEFIQLFQAYYWLPLYLIEIMKKIILYY